MKRKAKIITTIASLCLAVALLAFGVYAATSATLGVTSKVKFEVVDVAIIYNVKVTGGDPDTFDDVEGYITASYGSIWGDAYSSGFTSGQTLDFSTAEDYGADASEDVVIGATSSEIEFDSSEESGRKIEYLITVYNAGTNTASLTVTINNSKFFAETVSSASTNMTVVTKKSTNGNSVAASANDLTAGEWAGTTTLGAGKYSQFYVSIALNDVCQNVSTGNELDVSFVASLPSA